MNLILLESDEVQADGTALLSGHRARHIREVLKTAPGEEIQMGVIDGLLGIATVLDEGPPLRVQCRFNPDIPPLPCVDLLLAMPRPKVMNRLWPVLASLGVGRILISNAWKTERHYFDTHILRPDHIRKGLIEGLQQARDTRLPKVSVHRQFKKLVEDDLDAFGPYAARFAAHPGAQGCALTPVAERLPDERVLLAVGPEGGWTPFELDLLAAHGFTTLSWGPRTLRTDTACSVLLGLIHAVESSRVALRMGRDV
ncbi:MAG: RsmE family RNA methyltransferase [Kiritimatiellae bacterium]|jgi:RsmE family RNA methyltransferase|nr:RsmE family RNA methyltransferase [Kiritimatiellia bacterium]MDD4340946.1 RsmE family RNA methyltransferase [Kiritimatiellia bacterium]MDY0148651.1 RsmE family RNA methyltransferase [Kiritimatiellia bacterium]